MANRIPYRQLTAGAEHKISGKPSGKCSEEWRKTKKLGNGL